MDGFINLAKQGFEKYQDSQSKPSGNSPQQHNTSSNNDFGKTGGAEYNSPSHADGGRQGHGIPDLDDHETVSTASAHGSGDNDLFSQALGFLKSSTGQSQAQHPVNEEHVQNAHDQAYNKGQASQLDASSLGSAAALQALKSFTTGSSSGSAPQQSSGGNLQSKLIGMAMAEASKLFDKSGGTASGNKQDAVNGAASTVLKLLVQSKFSGTTGAGSSGGIGQLAGLASKFL